MNYVSTRNNLVSFNFKEVLFKGFAPDGGLFVPALLKELPWKTWKGKSYPFIVGELLKAFINDEDIPIHELLKNVYNENHFDDPSIAPVIKLNDEKYLLELFHGPTWAFKDYSLLLVGELLQYYLVEEIERTCLLIATSGDTGSSAIEAVKNKPNIDIIVMYPFERITKIQEKQMTTVRADNVHVVAVESNSDELDNVIRDVVSDREFNKKYNLGSINSINWARICLQMAHWFYAYLQTCGDEDCAGPLTVAVPVGAAGNLTAGLYAKKLGLPINIIACSNKNDVVHRWIQTGVLESGELTKTLAVAMDIQVPYNVERIIYLFSNGNDKLVKELMEQFYATGKVFIPEDIMKRLKQYVQSCSVTDEQILDTVKGTYDQHSYYCCPHTATAIYGFNLFSGKRCLCISPAAPYKFPEIFQSVQVKLPYSNRIRCLENAQPLKIPVWRRGENWVEMLKEKIRCINSVI